MEQELMICRYQSDKVIAKFTYTKGEPKPYRIAFSNSTVRCDEKTFGELLNIIISNVEGVHGEV